MDLVARYSQAIVIFFKRLRISVFPVLGGPTRITVPYFANYLRKITLRIPSRMSNICKPRTIASVNGSSFGPKGFSLTNFLSVTNGATETN